MERVKNKVIEWITKRTEGKATVFKPKKIKEADFVVKKRGEYKSKPVRVQVRESDILYNKRVFVNDIQEKGFEPQENLYLIFAYFDLVEQDLSNYIWLVPSSELKNFAESTTSESGEPVLRFEAPIDPKKKNKYTKFLINKKDLAQVLIKIATTEKFEFPEAGPQEFRDVNLKELKKFIAEARKNAYAGEGKKVDNPRLPGSTQMEYQKGSYLYRDIYFSGEKNFMGQEVVYQNNTVVWSMVYCGSREPKETSKFLKKSLFNLAKECRFGGKCEFEKGPFRYEDKGQGNLEKFNGEEKMFIKGEKIYNLMYRGGSISK